MGARRRGATLVTTTMYSLRLAIEPHLLCCLADANGVVTKADVTRFVQTKVPGASQSDVTNAANDLFKRGYILQDGDRWRITDPGRALNGWLK